MNAATVESARLLAPRTKVAGKYRLLRRLARGGMGEVWVARNESTGAAVAVKALRPDHDERDNAAARFRFEARLGGRLSHRNIVQLFDFVEEPDGTLLLVMELLRGESLEQYAKHGGPLDARAAVSIVVPVLRGLAHAHANGVIHRDVTPANVFLALDPDGHITPKIVDFGIAKLPAAPVMTADGLVLGTPCYMSPERVRGRSELDGRSDLFSVAVMLFELLTGECPFARASAAASFAAVLEDEVDPAPSIDPRLWLVIQRGLAKQPYERHATADEMAKDLLAAIGATETPPVALSLARLPALSVPDAELEDRSEAETMAHEVARAEAATPPSFRERFERAHTLARRIPSWTVGCAVALVAIIVAWAGLRDRGSPEGAATPLDPAPYAARAEGTDPLPTSTTSASASSDDPVPVELGEAPAERAPETASANSPEKPAAHAPSAPPKAAATKRPQKAAAPTPRRKVATQPDF